MLESLNDYERITTLKSGFTKYGKLVSSIIIAVLLIIAGWQYWQYQQSKQAEQASSVYTDLTNNIVTNNTVNIEAAANELMSHYPDTPYAKLAALTLAQRAVKDNKLDLAVAQLSWVLKHKQQIMLSQLAQISLARILMAQQKPQAALAMLAGAEQIYPAEASIVHIKALLALGKKAEAREHLRRVINQLPADSPMLLILNMYLNDI